jgi:hypothetical protein
MFDPTMPDSLDVVTQPPWSAARAAMKLLTAIADARTSDQAERRFDQLMIRAEKSVAFTNAAYLGAQVLRDMDILSRNEATYVFRELFDLRSDEYLHNDPYHEAHLKAYVKETTERPSAADSETRVDRLTDELMARECVLEARFHRVRGEVRLAELLLRDNEFATNLAADGQCSLIVEKPDTDDAAVGKPDPAVVAAICERIAALAAADTTPESLARYQALTAALRVADVASGMAAVGELRHIGLVSFTESILLLSDILDPLFHDEVDADRECAYLEARIEELSGERPQESGRRLSAEKTRRAMRALEKRLEARMSMLRSMCLRRFGEHEAATLLIENPKEFARLEGTIGLGRWDGRTGRESGG